MGLFDLGLKQKTDAFGQSEYEKKLVSHVRQKVEEVRSSSSRIAHEGIWMTNIAYLLGYDGLTYNSGTRQFQPINRASPYPKKDRIHVNKILPTIQNRLARLCKNPPKYDVRPESNSTDDKEAARISLQTLQCMWEKLTIDQKRLFLYMWVQECGHAWMKVCWDPVLGKIMVDPETGQKGFEGDIRLDVVSPFEIFPDPMAKSFDDVLQSWVIQCKVRSLDYFKSHYEKKGHLVKEEDAWLLSAQYEATINTVNTRSGGGAPSNASMKNSAIEMIKFEARSLQYPMGRMIICANGVLLEDKELPVGELPFAKFDDIIIGGKFNSESVITHLRPLQDYLNEIKRKRSDWTKKLLAGKYAAARGSALIQEALNDQSGEVVHYTVVPNAPNGGAPQPIQVPMIPQYIYAEEDRIDQDFNEISGISEVSKGTLPSASIPAIGMQLLTEQDDTRIGVMTEQHEHSWARVGSLILKYVEKYYIMPRKLKMSGKGNETTVLEISGEMLQGNTDVRVIRGSTLPGSKVLKRQEILNAYTQGLLGDPADPKVREKVLSMLEFGDLAEMWADQVIDDAQIERGIKQLEQGIPVEVHELDNHVAWMQELNRYRKGDKWLTLPPEIQALFEETLELHIDIAAQMSGMMPPEQPMSPEEFQAQTAPQAVVDETGQEMAPPELQTESIALPPMEGPLGS